MKRRGPIIFLSYAREDKDKVAELYRRLVHAGLNPWMDDPPLPYQRDGIPPGADWDATIRSRLKQAGLFFACFSKTSIEKESYVQREYKLAVDRLNELPPGRIFLVAVLLERCSPREIRIDTQTLNSRQWYRLYRDGIRGLIQLGEKVAAGNPVTSIPGRGVERSPLHAEEGIQPLGDSLSLIDSSLAETISSVMDRMSDIVPKLVEWKQRRDALPRPVPKKKAKTIFREVVAEVEEFHPYMSAKTIELEQLFEAAIRNYSEAMAVASDAEFVNKEIFDGKLDGVRRLRGLLEEARDIGMDIRTLFLSWERGSTAFNRARRLGAESCGAFGGLMENLRSKTVELEESILESATYL